MLKVATLTKPLFVPAQNGHENANKSQHISF
jgi:hypothetical protein